MDTRSSESLTPGHVPDDAGIDLAQALLRMANDSELLQQLAVIFIEDAPTLLQKAATGSEPLQLEEAARSAHSLKGLAANFSAAAANAAHAAEMAIRSGDRARIGSSLINLHAFIERLTAELKRSVLHESRDDL